MKAFKSTLSLSGGQAQGYNKRQRRQDVTAENSPGYNGNRSYNRGGNSQNGHMFFTGGRLKEHKSCIGTVFYGKLTLYANAPLTMEGRIPVES